MRLPPWVNFDAPRADLQQPGALGWCTLADGRQTTNLGVRSSKSLRARQLDQTLRMILPIDPGPFAYLGYTTRYTTALPQREVSSRTAPLSLPREFLRSYLAWGCS